MAGCVLCKQLIRKHSPTRLLTLIVVFDGLYYLTENIFFRLSKINDLAYYWIYPLKRAFGLAS
jgi:hypothetical protein